MLNDFCCAVVVCNGAPGLDWIKCGTATGDGLGLVRTERFANCGRRAGGFTEHGLCAGSSPIDVGSSALLAIAIVDFACRPAGGAWAVVGLWHCGCNHARPANKALEGNCLPLEVEYNGPDLTLACQAAQHSSSLSWRLRNSSAIPPRLADSSPNQNMAFV
ncbi:hypothetical protein GE21DRAFT_1253622 [Neurospora crassa]|nr:hypothetical protein GE21DRAFT_1253622 [Neurospora crassa]